MFHSTRGVTLIIGFIIRFLRALALSHILWIFKFVMLDLGMMYTVFHYAPYVVFAIYAPSTALIDSQSHLTATVLL